MSKKRKLTNCEAWRIITFEMFGSQGRFGDPIWVRYSPLRSARLGPAETMGMRCRWLAECATCPKRRDESASRQSAAVQSARAAARRSRSERPRVMSTSRLLNWACSRAAGRADTVQEVQVVNGSRQSTVSLHCKTRPLLASGSNSFQDEIGSRVGRRLIGETRGRAKEVIRSEIELCSLFFLPGYGRRYGTIVPTRITTGHQKNG